MNVVIREAQETDYVPLIAIWQRVGFYYPPWDSTVGLRRKQHLQPHLFLVAERGGQVLGGVIGTYDGWAAYVNHLAVTPDDPDALVTQSRLLAELEGRFRSLGVSSVFVFTLPHHVENTLYATTGYREWGSSQGWEKAL